VVLAARGAREAPGGGTTSVADVEDAQRLARQARRIHLEALALAIVIVALAMLARVMFISSRA
jgi:hypothetical protein